MFKCVICGNEYNKMGYGIKPNGDKICFSCCGQEDLKRLMNLKKGEREIQYLTKEGVENWPGTMLIKPIKRKIGKHNFAKTREDVWFELNGKHFHGVQYGDFSQLCYITVVK